MPYYAETGHSHPLIADFTDNFDNSKHENSTWYYVIVGT
jgi:hypothetical protein